MRKTFQKVFVIIAVCAPAAVFAASGDVVFNEIAWSGTKADDTDEWIELRNNATTAIVLDGWQVRAKDGAPLIMLSGSVPADGFYLIERTADSVVNGVAGDYVGSFGKNGSIENSGEDLELFDASGVVVDSVLFSSGWPAGTAGQGYFSMERIDPKKDGLLASNWASNNGVTRNGTDAAGNPINGTSKQENSVFHSGSSPVPDSSLSDFAPSSSSSVSPFHPIYPALSVDAGPDRTVLAGLSVSFSGLALGINSAPLLDARFLWNFGDGTVREGRALEHVYYFPGAYVAALSVSSGQYSGFDTAVVIVVPPALVVKNTQTGEDGFVAVANSSDASIDLGGIILRDSAGAQFVIPKNTFIAPKGEVIIPNRVSGLLKSGGAVAVYDAAGREVRTTQSPASVSQSAPQSRTVREPARAVETVALAERVNSGAREKSAADERGSDAEAKTAATMHASKNFGFSVPASVFFLAASFGIAAFASVGFFLLRGMRQ